MKLSVTLVIAVIILAACGKESSDDSSGSVTEVTIPAPAPPDSASSPMPDAADFNYASRVFWGDTHLHTSNSFDVYLFGTPNATADTAYQFARGEAVTSPTTGEQWQLKRPLDFLVIADHAEMIGSISRLYDGDPEIAETATGRAFLEISPEQTTEELWILLMAERNDTLRH